jgi:purine-nucleoside phosphorylase
MSAYEVAANYILSKTSYRPEIGIICGSGLSNLSKQLTNSVTINYEDIPGFPKATVPGHFGELVFGLLGEFVCITLIFL